MNKIKRAVYYWMKDKNRFIDSIVTNFFKWLPDVFYSKLRFRFNMGYWPDLKKPKTLNEKLTWLKLYDKRVAYTQMADKYSVKDYVASRIGTDFIIPTIGVWNRAEDIEWSQLPNQFVLKTTHSGGSTGVIICRNKESFDKDKAILRLKESLNNDIYINSREWVYKDIPKKIIAEPYIEDKETKELRDYKFFCANGAVLALFVASERQKREEPYFDFFDDQFNHLPIRQGHPNSPYQISKPVNFEKMKVISSKLSNGIPFVRVDLYEANGQVFFGEMTFCHFGAMVPFEPEIWDYKFGDLCELPSLNRT